MAGKYIITKYDQANEIVRKIDKPYSLSEARKYCEDKVYRKSHTLVFPKIRKGKHIIIYQIFDETELIEAWSITEI